MSADQLAAHALDLFAGLGPGVTARRMFGGLGFYFGGLFFAIGDPDEGRLFLKVDDTCRAEFERVGGRPFVYGSPGHPPMTMSGYLSPPEAALDDPEEMFYWARLAVSTAERAAAAKAAKKVRLAGRAAARRKAPSKGRVEKKGRASKTRKPARAS
jgi:DNA transformation protein and related proteins